jgi:hypothetical protein
MIIAVAPIFQISTPSAESSSQQQHNSPSSSCVAFVGKVAEKREACGKKENWSKRRSKEKRQERQSTPTPGKNFERKRPSAL